MSKSVKRIYSVENIGTGKKFLVEAYSRNQAIRVVSGQDYVAQQPTALQVAVLMKEGVAIIFAPKDIEAEPAENKIEQ